MKKTISMILALAMMLCLLTSFACADDEYAEHMDFSATFQEFGTVKGTDAVYDYFCDKFNIDVEMIPVSGDSFDEKNTIMINGGTMTDWMMTFLDYGAYCTYAEQGMLKPLPEDWETRWPNIANMVESFLYNKKCRRNVDST